jgi:hypothetical protein
MKKNSGVHGGHPPEENHIFIDSVGDVGPGRLILAGRMHLMGADLRQKFSEKSSVTKGAMGAQNFLGGMTPYEKSVKLFLFLTSPICLITIIKC